MEVNPLDASARFSAIRLDRKGRPPPSVTGLQIPTRLSPQRIHNPRTPVSLQPTPLKLASLRSSPSTKSLFSPPCEDYAQMRQRKLRKGLALTSSAGKGAVTGRVQEEWEGRRSLYSIMKTGKLIKGKTSSLDWTRPTSPFSHARFPDLLLASGHRLTLQQKLPPNRTTRL